MTVLVLLAGAAWTRVITPYRLLHVYRHLALLLAAVCNEVCPACAHLAHVRLALRGRSLDRSGLSQRDMRPEKERQDVLAEGLKHILEEIEALELIYQERVFLLVCRVLH